MAFRKDYRVKIGKWILNHYWNIYCWKFDRRRGEKSQAALKWQARICAKKTNYSKRIQNHTHFLENWQKCKLEILPELPTSKLDIWNCHISRLRIPAYLNRALPHDCEFPIENFLGILFQNILRCSSVLSALVWEKEFLFCFQNQRFKSINKGYESSRDFGARVFMEKFPRRRARIFSNLRKRPPIKYNFD